MRKVKNKSQEDSKTWVQERKHEARQVEVVKQMSKEFIRKNEYLAFYAAIGSLESQFFDYARQDVQFPMETEKKFFRAYKYVVNFFNKLTDHYNNPDQEKTKVGFAIYIQALEKLSQSEKTKIRLNLDMENERENADFLFLAGIIQTIRLTNTLIKRIEDKWIKDYYYSFKIQMQMVVNIFDREIKSQTVISEETIAEIEASVQRYKDNVKRNLKANKRKCKID